MPVGSKLPASAAGGSAPATSKAQVVVLIVKQEDQIKWTTYHRPR